MYVELLIAFFRVRCECLTFSRDTTLSISLPLSISLSLPLPLSLFPSPHPPSLRLFHGFSLSHTLSFSLPLSHSIFLAVGPCCCVYFCSELTRASFLELLCMYGMSAAHVFGSRSNNLSQCAALYLSFYVFVSSPSSLPSLYCLVKRVSC